MPSPVYGFSYPRPLSAKPDEPGIPVEKKMALTTMGRKKRKSAQVRFHGNSAVRQKLHEDGRVDVGFVAAAHRARMLGKVYRTLNADFDPANPPQQCQCPARPQPGDVNRRTKQQQW